MQDPVVFAWLEEFSLLQTNNVLAKNVFLKQKGIPLIIFKKQFMYFYRNLTTIS